MSWSGSGTVENQEVTLSIPGEISQESSQQASVASKAIQAIVKSGALGDPTAKYHISVSGHANPDHEPVSGWSNDSLYISITQASKEGAAQ
jgi:hypothetical protein